MKPTIEQARAMYAQGGAAKDFILKFYTEKELENTLSKTWEEAVRKLPQSWYIFPHSAIIEYKEKISSSNSTFKIHLPTEELCEAMIAFHQLILLREEYRGGWVPDWNNGNQMKWCIRWDYTAGLPCDWMMISTPLSFPTKELAVEFLNNFRDLLEAAKPLLS